MNMGWECPKCGACYAPSIKKCKQCNGIIEAIGKPLPPAKVAPAIPTIHLQLHGNVNDVLLNNVMHDWLYSQFGKETS